MIQVNPKNQPQTQMESHMDASDQTGFDIRAFDPLRDRY